MDDLYHEHILDHARSPRNTSAMSAEQRAVAVRAKNVSCGDQLAVVIETNADGKITNVVWQGEGCAISMAAASMLSEELLGSSVSDWEQLSEEDVLEKLGLENISLARRKCALLFWRAVAEDQVFRPITERTQS